MFMCLVVSNCFATPWTVGHHAPLSMKNLQARILEWVATSSSRGSSLPRDQTHISCVYCIGRRIHYHFATWEAHIPDCRVRELEKARFGKRTRPELYRNGSPLMRREGAAVRLVSCCTNPRKELSVCRHTRGDLLS